MLALVNATFAFTRANILLLMGMIVPCLCSTILVVSFAAQRAGEADETATWSGARHPLHPVLHSARNTACRHAITSIHVKSKG